MRVTNHMMTQQAIRNMSGSLEALADLQKRVSDGKNFHRVSEDPANATAAINLRSSLRSAESYLETAYTTQDWMDATEFSLGQATGVLTNAILLADEGIPDTLSAAERQSLAIEADALIDATLDIVNAKHNGSYIFSGFSVHTEAFIKIDPNTIQFQGDSGVIEHAIAESQRVAVNINGDAVFSPFFSALIGLRDALNADDSATVQASLSDLNAVLVDLTDVRTAVGGRQRQMDNAITRSENAKQAILELLSAKENADMAEAIAALAEQETVYQSVLQAGNRIFQTPNLFSFLG